MKLPLHAMSLLLVLVCSISADAQKRNQQATSKARDSGTWAIVIDETLSVLRSKPSLYAEPVQRMRRGRKVRLLAGAETDGVRFFRVSAPPGSTGWIQSEAVFGKFRPADEDRLARLVQAAAGFDQIELASMFLRMYPASRFRPAILLLFGDLLENAAAKLSRDARSRLSRREMAATGAPAHSYFLNFNMLDRYRRLGITFLFNPSVRTFHYNGASWLEIVRKHSGSDETAEAQKRLDSLKEKLEQSTASN